MGEKITLTCKDGQKIAAYVARPAGAPQGAVVVLQEIFGANQHIRAVADLYAREGYLAIAPSLFDRVNPASSLDIRATITSGAWRSAARRSFPRRCSTSRRPWRP